MASTLVVTQSESELTVLRKTSGENQTVIYRLDGSESTNPGPRGTVTTKSS